jgi:hypothetical protein
MPIVPMKQTVIRKRGGGLDDWGNPIAPVESVLKCRVDEGSTLTRYMSAGTSSSETVVANARLLFDKLADIRYDDLLAYTNELGTTIERKPKEINVKRNGSGKPILTEVFV